MKFKKIAEKIASSIEWHYSCQQAPIKIEACEISRNGKQLIFTIALVPGTKVGLIFKRAIDVQTALGVGFLKPFWDGYKVCILVADQPVMENSLQKILESPMFHSSKMWIPIALGYDLRGVMWIADLAKFPHALYGGATLSGKTSGLRSLLVSIIVKQPVNKVNIVIIDVATGDLNLFSGLPHLSCPIVKEPKTAVSVMSALVDENSRRSRLSLDELVLQPALICVVDEYLTLIRSVNDKKAELKKHISELLDNGRHVKIHMVLATHEPSKKSMEIDLNCLDVRVAFRCSNFYSSKAILGEHGAETLPGNGAMLFKLPQNPKPTYLQGAYMPREEMKQLVAEIANRPQDLSRKFTIPVAEVAIDVSQTAASLIQVCDSPDINSVSQPVLPSANLAMTPPKLDPRKKELADITLWTLRQTKVSSNKMQKHFKIGKRADDLVEKLFQMKLITDKRAKLQRKVLPQCIEDVSAEVREFLTANGVSDEDIAAAFEGRKVCSNAVPEVTTHVN